MIDNIIIENNLQGIHSEVLRNLKDVDSEEVDFGFTLLRLYCKNWRSIDEADIYFEDGDKILITGKNGSGKSSLLSALKYAFLECRNIKDYLQFGEKECILAVEFMYQGKKCKIQRGNKNMDAGLMMNLLSIIIRKNSKKICIVDFHLLDIWIFSYLIQTIIN